MIWCDSGVLGGRWRSALVASWLSELQPTLIDPRAQVIDECGGKNRGIVTDEMPRCNQRLSNELCRARDDVSVNVDRRARIQPRDDHRRDREIMVEPELRLDRGVTIQRSL